MNWLLAEQDFSTPEYGPGRIVVRLADGTGMSIINDDRNEYIREQKMWNASAILHGWEVTDVLADDDEYEVGLIDADGEFLGGRLHPEPPGWSAHVLATSDDPTRPVYANITAQMIEALVAERGLA